MRNSLATLAALALGGLLVGISPANAESPAATGDQGTAAASGSGSEEVQPELPESAKEALQSCSLEDLTAALADISDNNEAKDQLTRVRDAVVVVSDALAKSEKFDNAGDAENAMKALKPAFGKLLDLTVGGCGKHANDVLKAMAELSAPYQLQHRLEQAIQTCDLPRMRSLAGQLNGGDSEGSPNDDMSLKEKLAARLRSFSSKLSGNGHVEGLAKDDKSLKNALAALSAFDAAEDALKSGDPERAAAELERGESALAKLPMANCEQVKTYTEDMQQQITALSDYGGKLSRATADCDKTALKDIADKLSESRGYWVGHVSDDLVAAYRTCSEQTASWRKELERDL